MCFRKKKIESSTGKNEKKYTCLFCREQFTEAEIIFGVTLKTPDSTYKDKVFEDQLSHYQHKVCTDKETGKTYGLVDVYRRMIDRSSPKTHVISREMNGLPLIIEGPLESNNSEYEAEDDGLMFNESGDQQKAGGSTENEIIKSEERLCPHCHFTLPKGFADEKVFQIGLLGGSRSGKTTYMAVVTEYLQRKMGKLDSGLNLAYIELLPECRKYQEALYFNQRKALGAEPDPIVGDIKDHMIMPIILHFTPFDKNFKPFFVIFQDIPGEYLLPGNRKYLINSNIPKSNHIIMLVDINHFIMTDQQEGSKFGAYCNENISTLFANIEALGEVIPKGQLKSVQCTLTKLDFWIKADEHLKEARFTVNCDEEHRGGIDVNRLGIVHEQLNEHLSNIGGSNQSGLLDNLIDLITLKNPDVCYAYTAVASRIVPGHEEQISQHGADYQSSLNVLEPLMNIFDWENALPKKDQQA